MRLILVIVAAVIIGGLSVAIHPLAPFAAIAVVFVVGLGVYDPLYMLMMFVVVLLTRPAEFFPALAAVPLAKTLALGSIGIWLAHKMIKKDASWVASPLNPYFLLLMGVLLGTCPFSSWPKNSLDFFFENFLKIGVIYVLILNLLDTPRRAAAFQLVIAFSCVFLAGYAIYAKQHSIGLIEGSRAAFVGLLGDPNDLAFALLMVGPFLLAAFLENQGGRRIGYFALFSVLALGMLATQSRGGILGFLVGGYFLFRGKIKSRLASGVVIALLSLGAIVAGGLHERSSGAVGATMEMDESAQGRLDAWKAGLEMLLHHPLTGVGLKQFTAHHPLDAHNAYIKVAAETGLVGLFAFLMLVFLSLRCALNVSRIAPQVPHPTERALARALFPALMGMFTSAFFLTQSWIWFIYIMMALSAAAPHAFQEYLEVSVEGAEPDPQRAANR